MQSIRIGYPPMDKIEMIYGQPQDLIAGFLGYVVFVEKDDREK